MRRLDAARRVLDASAPESVKDLAAKLRKHFDRVTVERAVELLLNDDARRALGAELFRELGLVDRHT